MFDAARLSATTLPLINQPLEEALATLAGIGLRKVDLLGRGEHLSLDSAKWSPARAAELAAKHRVTIAHLASYGGKGFTSDDPADHDRAWQEITRLLDVAAELGCRTVRVYSIGSVDERVEHIDRIVPWYRKAAGIAEQRNVYMGVENHGGAISGDPQRCLDLAQRVGSKHFGILYDPCNLLTAGVDPGPAFELLKEHVVHVHIKDGKFGVKASQRETALGEGDLDLVMVKRQLDSIDYTGDITLEYEHETIPVEVGLRDWLARMTR